MPMENKKVFVCHASEDKERFVEGFARRLRRQGIDAWLDKWEMLPGDSLVDKLFEEGIRNADAMIVVLSTNSVNKPWVRKEMDTGVIEQIEKGTKLIPLVIDDCEIPESLKSIVRIRLPDLVSYDDEMNRVVMSILGQYDKPPLGRVPKIAELGIDSVPELSKVDTLVLKLGCEIAIEEGQRYLVNAEALVDKASAMELSDVHVIESLQVLDDCGHVKVTPVSGGGMPNFEITISGFDTYMRHFFPDYNTVFERIRAALASADDTDNDALSRSLGYPRRVIDHVFDILSAKGLIQFAHSLVGYEHRSVHYVSPQLRRIAATQPAPPPSSSSAPPRPEKHT